MDATSQRWIAALANYTFSLFYKCGKTNIEADALSRIPREENQSRISVNAEGVKAIINAMQLGDFTELNENPNLLICKSACPVPKKFSNEKWLAEQLSDENISQLIAILKGQKIEKDSILEDVRMMLRKRTKFVFRNDLLYRKNKVQHKDEEYLQFVLPRNFRKQVLEACHDDIGHLGKERVLSLLTDRFYWPNMFKDVEEYVDTCPRCLRFKATPEHAELNPIYVSRPLELVHMDFLTIESPKTDKDINVLIIISGSFYVIRTSICHKISDS